MRKKYALNGFTHTYQFRIIVRNNCLKLFTQRKFVVKKIPSYKREVLTSVMYFITWEIFLQMAY